VKVMKQRMYNSGQGMKLSIGFPEKRGKKEI
jgi:hypothetical protein